MPIISTVLVFVALLSDCHSFNVVQHFTKEFPVKASIVISNTIPKHDDSFSYTACSFSNCKNEIGGLCSKIPCEVTVETWPFPNGTLRDTCNINFEAGTNDRSMMRTIYSQPLTKKKILLYTTDALNNSNDMDKPYSRLRLSIINMETCGLTNFTLPITVTERNTYSDVIVTTPVIYNRSFDLALASKDACSGYDKCWLSFDFKGIQINEPKPYRLNVSGFLTPEAVSYPDKGFYMYVHKLSNDDLSLAWLYIDPAGDSKTLVNTTLGNSQGQVFRDFSAFSSANELFSICYKLHWIYDDMLGVGVSKLYQCSQFDGATIKMNVTLELPVATNWMVIHNVDEGEILVASMNCSFAKKKQTTCRKLRVLTVHADGRRSRELQVEGFEFHCFPYSMMVSNSWILEHEDVFCFIFTCHDIASDSLIYHKTCIQKEYVSIPYDDS